MVWYHTVRRLQEKIYPSPNQPHFSMHIYTSAYKWMEKKTRQKDSSSAGGGRGIRQWL